MCVINNGMAAPRTRGNRKQLNGEIDREVVEQFQDAWHRSGRKRWEVLQEVVELGLAEYGKREAHMPQTLDVMGKAG